VGILSESKLKQHESLQEFESELNKLQRKIRSKMLALVGLAGRYKGLTIVYVTHDGYDHDLKLFSAQLNEFIEPLNKLLSYRKVDDLMINSEGETLFFEPIIESVGFFANLGNSNNIFEIKHLLSKNKERLRELLHAEN
jgi:hypothetical protein